ncbi:MAG: rRNA adenine N-6-methyltransferase family protein, partial [Myxococcota bacterium]
MSRDTKPPLDAKARLEHAGLRPKKSWGQNFLGDATVHRDIARAVGASAGRTVVELGAGLGALTHFLLESEARVVAIERDRDLVPLLRDAMMGFERFEVREANAADLDYAELKEELGAPLRIAG